MDDDWETLADKDNVVIPPKIPNVNKWEGEDEDEDVKDSWEDEEEKKDEEKVKEEVVQPAKTKPKEKESLQAKNNGDPKPKEEVELSPEERAAEKLRLQKIQQEEDLKAAMDTFGITEQPSGIDGMHPTSKTEFSEFAQAISNKVSVYKSSEEFPGFVEELLRSICVHLQSSDMKRVKLTLDNLYLEKQKMEKEKTKKPSAKGKTKVKLRVEEEKDVNVKTIGDFGYDYDDYDDFM